MKIFSIFLYLLIGFSSYSQDITGIWRGYFIQQTFDYRQGIFVDDKYKYEVQINNMPNNALQGVTYSYQNTFFYGKASLQGIYNIKTKNIILREVKMLELKTLGSPQEACLMTCYLDYSFSKSKNKKILSGKYSSVKDKNGQDCGGGIVYLEKVSESEFQKEDFVIKNENQFKNNSINKIEDVSIDSIKYKNIIKPGAEKYLTHLSKSSKKIGNRKLYQGDSLKNKNDLFFEKDSIFPVPEVLQKRENVLSSTFNIDSPDILVEFFDNGQIDGDTISVYHNNRLLIDRQRLGYTPISLQIHIDEKNPIYEFITVAENLGAVAPNTALVVITSGSKHYEINITSDESRNAKIQLKYQKPPLKN